MHITKKFDRAFQWAGEKMGQEAKTGVSDEFKTLETEMALRHDGMYLDAAYTRITCCKAYSLIGCSVLCIC